MKEQYIAAVDFGSSKTALAVVRVEGRNATLLYHKAADSGTAIRYSAVTNATKVSGILGDLVRDAEDQLGIRISYLITGYPKYFIRSEKSDGRIDRPDPEAEISKDEVEGLKNEAMFNYPLNNPDSELVVGAVAQSFSTDSDINVPENNIIGMDGATLDGSFNIFIGKKADSTRIDNAVKKTGIGDVEKFFTPSLIADAILSDNEKKTGVALVDIGGGTTSVTVFCDEIVRHYASIPFGGNSVTKDIAIECGIGEELAEEIKIQYGGCIVSKMQNLAEKTIRINYGGSWKEVGIPYLTEIVGYRMQEIIEAVCYEIEQSKYADKLQNGIVITGGGANLKNICDLFKSISGYETRLGFDRSSNVNPSGEKWFTDLSCCTLWGLLGYAVKNDIGFMAEVDPAFAIRRKEEEERIAAARAAEKAAAEKAAAEARLAAEKAAAEAEIAAAEAAKAAEMADAQASVAEQDGTGEKEQTQAQAQVKNQEMAQVAEQPAEKPAEKPAEAPAEAPAETPAEEPAEAPAQDGKLFTTEEYEVQKDDIKRPKKKKPNIVASWLNKQMDRAMDLVDQFQDKMEEKFDPNKI